MSHGKWAVHGFHYEGLDIAFGGSADGAVTIVSYGVVPVKWGQGGGSEDGADEAGGFVGSDSLAVTDGDPGGFLAAMLQGEERKETEFGHSIRAGHGHYPAFLFGTVPEVVAPCRGRYCWG